jgi:transcriptional regulator with XRE-family HTH domain
VGQERKHPLRAFREAHDPALSQAEAAKLVGIDQSMWSLLETGKGYCRPRVAKRISRLTGVSVDLLLNWDDNEAAPVGTETDQETR